MKIHLYDGGINGTALCGNSAKRVTTNINHVTCNECLKRYLKDDKEA